MLSDRSARQVDIVRWLLVLVVIACFAQTALAATKVITDADKGGVVHIKFADQLELRMKSNPSTGYMWYLEKESTPLLKLHHQSQTEPAEQSAEPAVGRPIFQVFTFEPRRVGEGVLRLHYVRSWEKPTPEDEQFKIRVVIE
ncbi:MAG: protease inhibitor I42 family protein [Terracidiphilus sp.]